MQKTKGEAHNIIRTCPLTNDGFALAWQNLEDRFENKRVLINAQLKILFNISAVIRETGPNLKNLQRTINDCITNLSLLNVNTDSWHVIFVYICSTKLPDNTLSLWEQSLKRDANMPKWDEMDKFLTARYQTLESVYDIRGPLVNRPHNPNGSSNPNNNSKKSHNESKRINSFATKTKPSQSVTRCVLCQEQHPLRLCPSFLRQSVDERT